MTIDQVTRSGSALAPKIDTGFAPPRDDIREI